MINHSGSSVRRWVRGVGTALVGLAVFLSAACSPTPTSSGPASPGGDLATLVWSKPAEVVSLDPHVDDGGNDADWEIYNLVYDGLVRLDVQQQVVPALAEKWEKVSSTEYVFDIRQGVKFSNGRTMTVDDVVGSLDRIMDPKTGSAWASRLSIKRATAVGTTQVRVVLSRPVTAFLPALALTMASILPMKELDDGSFDPNKEIIGTGPYVVGAHVQGQSWTFTRNDAYWGGPAKAKTVQVNITTNDSARIAALKNGSANVTTFESPEAQTLLKTTRNVTTVAQEQNYFYRLDVNAKNSLFADSRLRQALALSINRDDLVNLALGGVGKPSAVIVPSFGVCDPAQMPFGTYDPARAASLVDAAGARGKTVHILTRPSLAGLSEIAQVLQQDLQKTGLDVQIEQSESGPINKRVYSGPPADFDINISYSAGYSDPGMILQAFNPATAPYATGYLQTDPTLNKTIDQAVTLPNGPERQQSLLQACERIAQDANVIPLVTKVKIVAYRSDKIVANIGPVESQGVPLRDMAQFSAAG